MYQPGHGNVLDKGPEPVQKVIEAKIREQREDQNGLQRWEGFKANEYQSRHEVGRNRELVNKEHYREDQARRLAGAGPLRLVDCIVFALEFNDQVQAKRATIQAVGGEELVVRSRFLPQLFYNLQHEKMEHRNDEGSDGDTDQSFRLSQTLIEFGKDNREDVILRESQRTALFGYEDTVGHVISQIRLKFFTILLRQQQLAERRALLRDFREQYERIRKRYERKQVVEVDVLTARLNMLNEETRINSLRKETLRQKTDLLHLLGFPVGMTDIEVSGDLESLDIDLKESVDITLRRSTAIAQARAVVAEHRRRARQTLWEYAPDMRLQAGWKDAKNAAGLEVKGEDGNYALGSFGERHLDRPRNGFGARQDVLDDDGTGYFMGLNMEVPLFEGFKRRGLIAKERHLLRKARHELRSTIDGAERDVRKTYQTMLERREELRILAETVDISKKRLRAKERLKELDRIRDDELETFRERFFDDQDTYFAEQIGHVAAQERLRLLMRHFEPLPAKGSETTDEATQQDQ